MICCVITNSFICKTTLDLPFTVNWLLVEWIIALKASTVYTLCVYKMYKLVRHDFEFRISLHKTQDFTDLLLPVNVPLTWPCLSVDCLAFAGQKTTGPMAQSNVGEGTGWEPFGPRSYASASDPSMAWYLAQSHTCW